MPKPPPITQPSPSFWLPFVVIGLVGFLLGSTITYLALRPRLQSARETAAAPVLSKDPTTHLPPPELTEGQLPAEADHTRGNFYYDHQNWAEAIRSYTSAIKQGIDNADIRTDLGNAYRFSGRANDALTEYTRAQQLNPNHEFSLFNLGGLYLEDLRQPDKAVEVWNEYLTRFPSGRNVAAARDLIARVKSGAAGLPAPTATTPAESSATEDLILRKIKAGQADKSAAPAR